MASSAELAVLYLLYPGIIFVCDFLGLCLRGWCGVVWYSVLWCKTGLEDLGQIRGWKRRRSAIECVLEPR